MLPAGSSQLLPWTFPKRRRDSTPFWHRARSRDSSLLHRPNPSYDVGRPCDVDFSAGHMWPVNVSMEAHVLCVSANRRHNRRLKPIGKTSLGSSGEWGSIGRAGTTIASLVQSVLRQAHAYSGRVALVHCPTCLGGQARRGCLQQAIELARPVSSSCNISSVFASSSLLCGQAKDTQESSKLMKQPKRTRSLFVSTTACSRPSEPRLKNAASEKVASVEPPAVTLWIQRAMCACDSASLLASSGPARMLSFWPKPWSTRTGTTCELDDFWVVFVYDAEHQGDESVEEHADTRPLSQSQSHSACHE